ncbi:MAG TPA: 30S ribosomal protein S11, partial [Acidobacteriota bacterium]|nr:30S ribosomal protein S11 [Acidobacteriota bacterium]
MVKSPKKGKKKEKKVVPVGIAYIKATFNNAVITITDLQGNVVSWASAGTLGFKGSRKGTPFAAQQAASKCGQEAVKEGVRRLHIRV